MILLLTIVAVFAVAAVALLAVAVAAIRQEPRDAELGTYAPNLMAALVRRLLGVSVRRPETAGDEQREVCLTGHATGHRQEGDGR
jgi:hypothetical protein